MSARGLSFNRYLFVHTVRYLYIERPRALTLLNTPLNAMQTQTFFCACSSYPLVMSIKIFYHNSCDGRVVKALDLKSNGIFPRRFEPYSQRISFLPFYSNSFNSKSYKFLFYFYIIVQVIEELPVTVQVKENPKFA